MEAGASPAAPLICGTGGMCSKLIFQSQRWSSSGGRSGQVNFDAEVVYLCKVVTNIVRLFGRRILEYLASIQSALIGNFHELKMKLINPFKMIEIQTR